MAFYFLRNSQDGGRTWQTENHDVPPYNGGVQRLQRLHSEDWRARRSFGRNMQSTFRVIALQNLYFYILTLLVEFWHYFAKYMQYILSLWMRKYFFADYSSERVEASTWWLWRRWRQHPRPYHPDRHRSTGVLPTVQYPGQINEQRPVQGVGNEFRVSTTSKPSMMF